MSNEIIEIAAVKFEKWKPVQRFTTFVKPRKEIPQSATNINGITNFMLEDSPYIEQVIPEFIKFIEKDNIVGHNLKFDLEFLYVSDLVN